MKPKRGGKNAHKEVKEQVRVRGAAAAAPRPCPLCLFLFLFCFFLCSPLTSLPPVPVSVQRKSAWEAASAGAGAVAEGKTVQRSRDGAKGGGSGAKGGGSGAAAGGGGSLPSVEEMHPSWAARVKQQEAIKVIAALWKPLSFPHLHPHSPPFPQPPPPPHRDGRQKSRPPLLLVCTLNSTTDEGGCIAVVLADYAAPCVFLARKKLRSEGRVVSVSLLHCRDKLQMTMANAAKFAPAKYKSCA
jgi:hypothetical protein